MFKQFFSIPFILTHHYKVMIKAVIFSFSIKPEWYLNIDMKIEYL